MRSFAFPVIERRHFYLLSALIGFAIVGSIAAFPFKYLSGANSIIGICLLPFAFFRNGPTRFNYFYLTIILLFGALAIFFDVKVFYFVTVSAYVLFVVESFSGRVDSLILFLLLLMCPIFSQVVGILGFPIRLQLSQVSGSILQLTGMNVTVEGNTMTLNGADFAVDEACMGLNMLMISLLMGIFVIIHQYRTTGLRLPFKLLLIFFLAVFLLNVLSNVMRIVFLVAFGILPENGWHEVVGILCLISYVMFPLYFLAAILIKYFGKWPEVATTAQSFSYSHKVVCVVLGLVILCLGFRVNNGGGVPYTEVANVQLAGMKAESIGSGITKYNNEELLVYVKSIPQFFTGEHTPLFCWKGSGYQIKKLRKTEVDGLEVYTGVLEKGDQKLYTAWWYFNGSIHTIDQFTWRSVMLKGGKGFSLINVTTSDESKLHTAIEKILSKKLLTLTSR
jgi:exosortase N